MEVVEHRTWDTKSSISTKKFKHMIDARFLLGDQNPSTKVPIAINHVSETCGVSVTYQHVAAHLVAGSGMGAKDSCAPK